jgi:hypothetical protein
LQALDDDPKLLAVRPTPPSTGLNHLKPFNVSTVLIAVHKDSYTSLKLTNKAASTGGRPCTWHAVDAIAEMQSGAVLYDWSRLLALYPGW